MRGGQGKQRGMREGGSEGGEREGEEGRERGERGRERRERKRGDTSTSYKGEGEKDGIRKRWELKNTGGSELYNYLPY